MNTILFGANVKTNVSELFGAGLLFLFGNGIIWLLLSIHVSKDSDYSINIFNK